MSTHTLTQSKVGFPVALILFLHVFALVCNDMFPQKSLRTETHSGGVHHGMPTTLARSLAGDRNLINYLLTYRNEKVGWGGGEILPGDGKE